MATITEDYVSFETAKLLSYKGFKEPTLAYAYSDDMIGYYSKPRITGSLSVKAGHIPLPTLQMACKWLREVHNIVIVVTPSVFWGKYNVSIYKKGNDYPIGFNGDSLISSYEQACGAAIKYCLENLI